jgi:Ca-activated chloride channel homolog
MNSRDPTDLYTVLGVARSATATDIEAAYSARRVELANTPAEEGRDRLRYAFEVLSDPQRRRLYDSLVLETAAPALELELVLSATRLPLIDSPQLLYALMTIHSAESRQAGQQPLNLVLVIDRSTSMRGERLETVVRAVDLLLDKLGPDDSLAVVSFSDRAEVVLPARRHSRTNRATDPQIAAAWRNPHEQLQTIIASGGTEIFQGLRAGVVQARRMAPGHTSHLILLTDGHTYGDAADCLRLGEEAAAEGIDITALGIGADWNDQFLDALVSPSGGQSGYIEQAGDLLPLLESRLKGLEVVYGRNATLIHNWPSSVQLRSGFKLSPFPQPLITGEGAIPLGNLEGRAPLSFLLEFIVAPQPIATRFKLPIEIHYRVSADSSQFISMNHNAHLVVQSEARDESPPATIIEAARRLNLYRMQEKAWEEAQAGGLATAAATMHHLTTRYLETGDLKLAKQAQLESQRLAHMNAMSPEGRKILKYGTRSLMGLLES